MYANECAMGAELSWRAFLTEARRALGMSQKRFGYAVGSSHRTAARWDAGRSTPAPFHWTRLAVLLHPVDAKLAAQAARLGGATLESLGLVKAAPPPPPPAEPSTLPAKREDLVDVLVLAGMGASGASAADVRRWLHAVAARAVDVGLTMKDVVRALRPADPAGARDAAADGG